MKTKLIIIIGIAIFSWLGYVPYSHAEDCIYVSRNSPCIDSKYLRLSENDPDFTLAELMWTEAMFPIKNGTGFVTVILKDPDSNDNPNYKEAVNVFVHSDSDRELHIIELQETKNDSGIFERKFGISSSRSAPSVLFTQDGDTITAMYIDATMPTGYLLSDSHLIHHALVGSTGPPLERAPASNPRIVGLDEDKINFPSIGEQILLRSDITNEQNNEQRFVWIAQIIDSDKKTQALSWIDGTLNPQESFSPTTSWIPEREGIYNIVFFVWESINNPTALSPPIELEFTVLEKPLESDYSQIKGHVTFENIDKRLEETKKFIDSNTFEHATILQTDIDHVSKYVAVTISDEDFTKEFEEEYYEEQLENWIPFETRILVARMGQPNT